MMTVDRHLHFDLTGFHNQDILIRQIIDDRPIIKHVCGGHKVLDEGEDTECPIVAVNSVSVEEVGHEEEARE